MLTLGKSSATKLMITLMMASMSTSVLANEAKDIVSPFGTSDKSITQAAHSNKNDFVAALNKAGITYSLADENLNISIDQTLALNAALSLQLTNAIDSTIPKEEFDKHPLTYSGTIAFYYVSQIWSYVYQNSSADKLHVSVFLMSPDNYGNKQKHLMFSFDSDRNLYKKINWPNFSPANLQKVTYNFKFDDWYITHLKAE